ncbi:hypothetical protein [Streptomonospora nanhaiensis]|nr:hypothetical protein [Streptomonospora nanhaiensis]
MADVGGQAAKRVSQALEAETRSPTFSPQEAAQVRGADPALDRTVERMAATQERLQSNDRVPEAIVAAHGQQLALAQENQAARRVSGADAPRGLRPGQGDAARRLDFPRGALSRAVGSAGRVSPASDAARRAQEGESRQRNLGEAAAARRAWEGEAAKRRRAAGL